LQKNRPAFVGFIVRVLAAIRFYDQTMLGGGEVDDEAADGVLSAEPVTDQATIAQNCPEPSLGIR